VAKRGSWQGKEEADDAARGLQKPGQKDTARTKHLYSEKAKRRNKFKKTSRKREKRRDVGRRVETKSGEGGCIKKGGLE